MSSKYSSADFTDGDSAEQWSNRGDRGRHARPISDVADDFDIDLLLQRLEDYKAQLEETEADLRSQKILSPKELADVAAAARFREEIERRATLKKISSESPPKSSLDDRHGSPMSPLTPLFDNLSHVHSQEGQSPETSKQTRRDQGKSNAISTQFPTRSTSLAQRRNLTKRDIPVRSHSAVSRPSDLLENMPLGKVKLHQRSIIVSESRRSITDGIVPASDQTNLPQNQDENPKKSTSQQSEADNPLNLLARSEDQIRREMENRALQKGVALFDHSTRAHDIKQSTVHVIQLNTDPVDSNSITDSIPSSDVSMYDDDFGGVWTRKESRQKVKLRHKLSIFKMMKKSTTADKLIEMYMTEAQLQELKGPKRRLGVLNKRS